MTQIAFYAEYTKRNRILFVSKANEHLNSEKYCQKLDNLKTAVKEKRPAMFNRKNIMLHAALGTRQKNCRTRLGSFVASTIFPWLDILSTLLVFVLIKHFEGQKLLKMEQMSNKHWLQFSHQKDKIFEIGIYKFFTLVGIH